MKKRSENAYKKGQVTVFIIVAILLVVSIAGFFIFRENLFFADEIPAFAEPVYRNFQTCVDDNLITGVNLLGTHAGYIESPNYEPGSSYMPFSSHLNFLGNNVPYWYYVSANGVERINVPTRNDMEIQLGEFIDSQMSDCDFSSLSDEGFVVEIGNSSTDVTINGNNVEALIKMDLKIEKNNESVFIRTHNREITSKIGKLYDDALEVYDFEQKNFFLEEYGVDALRLYAPVDGVEVTCSPKIWNADEVFDDVQNAIEANTLALKSSNNRFDLKEENRKYFVVDLPVNSEVRFLNSKTWPSTFEVEPSEGNMLVAKPVGSQTGLGILGFCYVTYHHVFNARYPVLVQVQEGDEIFQFPVAVLIEGNLPRNSSEGIFTEFDTPVCEDLNTPFEVNVFDTSLNPVDARVSYECLGATCYIGETEFGSLEKNLPQCVNGFVVANADGFEEGRVQTTTTNPGQVDVILDKLYETDVKLKLDNLDYNGEAVVNFVSDSGTKTVIYPQTRKVNLSQGQYEIQVQIFRNTSIRIDSVSSKKCVEIPVGGVGSLMGLTKEECFDIEFPAQVLSNSLAGGGKQNYFILESELENSPTVEIAAGSLKIPQTLEDLQNNYIVFENKNLIVRFT